MPGPGLLSLELTVTGRNICGGASGKMLLSGLVGHGRQTVQPMRQKHLPGPRGQMPGGVPPVPETGWKTSGWTRTPEGCAEGMPKCLIGNRHWTS